MKLELNATPGEVMRAVEALQAFGRECGLEERALFGLTVALEECGSNIVNHALAGLPGATFGVEFDHSDGRLVIVLRDRGPAFDPTAATARRPQAEDGDPPGGWGIHLVRRYTDAIEYAREGDENVLRLIKRLEPEGGER